MEAAAVARRAAGMLVRARAGSRARARAWEHGVAVGSATSAARRRLRIAAASSLGVGEPLPAQSLCEEAVALEVDEDDVSCSSVSAENLPPDDADAPAKAKTVRVKFVLKKQCAFGQHFLVVGDDVALGLWDPAKAIPLNWSEEHVWTAKTDLPANKCIEFKFLLRDASGNVRWQHGENRTLKTTETPNTMVVHEDWDHAMKQEVLLEEEEVSIEGEAMMFPDDVAGSNSVVLEEEELSIEGETVIFPEDVAGSISDSDAAAGSNSDDVQGSNGAMLTDNPQTDENLETDKSAALDADAPLQGGLMISNGTNQPQLMVDRGQSISEELHGEENGTPSSSNDDVDATILCQEGDPLANRPTSILENDLAWAGKAMQQMLRILGFQIGTTRT